VCESSVGVLSTLLYCCWFRRGTSGSLSAKLQSGKPEDFPVSPQLHIYVMPSCSYRVSVSIAWTELYGQVIQLSKFCRLVTDIKCCVRDWILLVCVLTCVLYLWTSVQSDNTYILYSLSWLTDWPVDQPSVLEAYRALNIASFVTI